MLRRGENTGEYDWEYITELFQSNPENVPEMAYGAMIRIFNEMIISDQEKFIECAYTEHGTLHELYPYYIYTEVPILRREMKLSDVFVNMMEVYRLAVSAKTDNMNDDFADVLGNYNVLSAVLIHANTVYVRGFETGNESVNITILKGSDYSANDYVITYEGLTTQQLRNEFDNTVPSEQLTINVYAMRETGQLLMKLDDHAENISEDIRHDIKSEISQNFFNNVADIVLPEYTVLGVAQSIISYGTTIKEGIITNQNVDDIQEILNKEELYYALGVNASFSTCGNNYAIHTYSLTEGTIDENIKEYNEWASGRENFQVVNEPAYKVCQFFLQGNLEEIDGFDDFLTWITNKSAAPASASYSNVNTTNYN